MLTHHLVTSAVERVALLGAVARQALEVGATGRCSAGVRLLRQQVAVGWHLDSFSGPEWVTPLSPPGGILLSCVMVLYLESPPSTGCDASFKSLDFLGRLATRSVQSAAREVGSRQEVGDCSLRLEAGRAPPARLRRASPPRKRFDDSFAAVMRLRPGYLYTGRMGGSADQTYFSDREGGSRA